jgi:4-hydroxy-tetrahydrodipicolinate synthase
MVLAKLISALGTPLDVDERLHDAGLERHLNEQWANGIKGVLVGGSMGSMQLLCDATYESLVKRSVEFSNGKGELLVGAGDTSFARTRDRLEFLDRFAIDGVVIITPYFLKFSQGELLDYYRALASISHHPLYIYDAPIRTGVKLEIETVLRLAEHPNIVGIKCTCDAEWTRELVRRVDGEFRVIASTLGEMHELLRDGIGQHLDGLFALMPNWTAELASATENRQWEKVDEIVDRFVQLLELVRRFGSFASYTAIVNARGIPGNFAPAPLSQLTPAEQDMLLDNNLLRPELTKVLQGPHALHKYSQERLN